MTDWTPHLGGLTPRPQQIEILDQLAASDAEVLLLQAPPGAGKSLIEIALARSWPDTSYIATPQRALQDQLASYGDVKIMKGVSNYACPVARDDPDEHKRHPGCPYYRAVDEALASPLVVHNHASIVHQRRAFSPRHGLFLDEGHRAIEAVGGMIEISLSQEDIWQLDVQRDTALNDLLLAAERGAQDLYGNAKRVVRKIRTLPWVYGCGEEFEDDAPARPPLDLGFVESWSRDGLLLTPTKLSPVGSLITDRGDRVVIVSATILEPTMLLAELGLSKRSWEMIDADHTFPKENRPIVGRWCGKMSRKYQDQAFPRVMKALRDDMGHHAGEAGIIHTVSHALSEKVCQGLASDRVIRLPIGSDRDAVIEHFLSGRLGADKVLVGPGLHEGIDGLITTWQAIVKAPVPYIGDVRVKAILERNEAMGRKWLNWKTAQTFVQMCGRVCRSKEDKGVTYVYDSSCMEILNGPMCPRYLREAMQ